MASFIGILATAVANKGCWDVGKSIPHTTVVCNNVCLLWRHFFTIMRALWPRDAPSGHIFIIASCAILSNNRLISKWVKNFRQHDNVLPKHHTTCIPTVVKPENVDCIRMSVEGSPGCSIKRCAKPLKPCVQAWEPPRKSM